MKIQEAIKGIRKSMDMNVKVFSEHSGVPYHRYRRFEKLGAIRDEDLALLLASVNAHLFQTLVVVNGVSETKIKID